jgi:hypothetical protein
LIQLRKSSLTAEIVPPQHDADVAS